MSNQIITEHLASDTRANFYLGNVGFVMTSKIKSDPIQTRLEKCNLCNRPKPAELISIIAMR